MKVTTLFACHCLGLAWYAFLMHEISGITRRGRKDAPAAVLPYGGHWKFLTVLNLLLQAVYYGVALLVDACVLMKKYRIAKSMFPLRDLLFGALAFPVSMFVFTCFWALYSYDRELVYPKDIDLIIPTWTNHAMHTTILPLVLLELLVTPRRNPSKAKGISFLLIASVAYVCWLLWIHSVTGKWAYPFFDFLSPLSTTVFFLGCAVFLLFFFNMGGFLCRMIWGDSIVILDIYKKKSK
ncbi:androgen-dependent TFPI-regulating protein isoform X1 [Hemicordylus capensis]|uniref:androgen-dependent TFPI-regulating protein isoform X1 n=1 Tax=Hemicordylus capensis TaxID=884348 RepID=UPI0023033417|nr:androgen-dependent TFPI-regulating protein isoform X1 [Hemicordylus capensis]